jgi:regulator of sigma D
LWKLIVTLHNQWKRKKTNSRIHTWKDTDQEEIEVFLGILLWMGLCRYPKISDYWSQNKIYSRNIRQYMSRNRFEILLRMLHFSDNNGDLQPTDRMQKIFPLVTQLRERFQSVIIPEEDVCNDESLVPFRGRLAFKQYIKNKDINLVFNYLSCVAKMVILLT